MCKDAAHAGDLITRRSQTGIIFMLNCVPILWHNKRQATVEASTFGSEFVALRTGVEMNDGFSIQTSNDGNPNYGTDEYLL